MTLGTIALVALIVGAVLVYIQMRRNKISLDYLFEQGAPGFFKAIGAFSTIAEVVGLAIIAVSYRGVSTFNALARYSAIGLFEVFCTFLFISIFSNSIRKAAVDGVITWLEILKTLMKSGIFFVLGFGVTWFISLLYLESLFLTELTFTGELAPWRYLSFDAVDQPYNGEVIPQYGNKAIYSGSPELGAIFLIYMTPLCNIFLVIFTWWNIMKLKSEGRIKDVYGDLYGSSGRRSGGSGGSNNSGGSSGSGGDEDDDSDDSSDEDSDDEDDEGSDEDDEDSGEVDEVFDFGVMGQKLQYLSKVIEDYKEDGKMTTAPDFTVEEVKRNIYKRCGVNPDRLAQKEHKIYSITSNKVRDYLEAVSNGETPPVNAMQPHEEFENLQEAILGDSSTSQGSAAMLSGIAAVEHRDKQIKEATRDIDTMKEELREVQRLIENAEGRSDSGAARMYRKQEEEITNRLQEHLGKLNKHRSNKEISVKHIVDVLKRKKILT